MRQRYSMIVTIDGLSGSGKSVVSFLLAKKLQVHFLGSGFLYRFYAYDKERMVSLVESGNILSRVSFELTDDGIQFFVDGSNITNELVSDENSRKTSLLAKDQNVRDLLLSSQRCFFQQPGLGAEGRDMGSVIFPNAEYKFFLVADLSVRAKRRYNQLKSIGIHDSFNQIKDEMKKRDERDNSVRPEQSILIDATHQSIEQVISELSRNILSSRV